MKFISKTVEDVKKEIMAQMRYAPSYHPLVGPGLAPDCDSDFCFKINNMLEALDNPDTIKGDFIYTRGVLLKLFDTYASPVHPALRDMTDKFEFIIRHSKATIYWINEEATNDANLEKFISDSGQKLEELMSKRECNRYYSGRLGTI